MKKESKHTEYALQYRFVARGRWHTAEERYYTREDAKADYDVQSNPDIHINTWAKHWRIVRREVGEWEEVECSER